MTVKLHALIADPGKLQSKKRVGRGDGSGQGSTAGKGHKGMKSRSGGTVGNSFEGGQMPLIRRLPKFGFDNSSFRVARAEVTLAQLNRFEDGAIVDRDALHAKRMVSKKAVAIKLIATGKLERKLTVRLTAGTARAREAVEALGGQFQAV